MSLVKTATAYRHIRPRVGAKYRIKHISFGEFTGECVQSEIGWAGFRVLDGNSELADGGVNPGEIAELTTDFYTAMELKPEWNRRLA